MTLCLSFHLTSIFLVNSNYNYELISKTRNAARWFHPLHTNYRCSMLSVCSRLQLVHCAHCHQVWTNWLCWQNQGLWLVIINQPLVISLVKTDNCSFSTVSSLSLEWRLKGSKHLQSTGTPVSWARNSLLPGFLPHGWLPSVLWSFLLVRLPIR